MSKRWIYCLFPMLAVPGFLACNRADEQLVQAIKIETHSLKRYFVNQRFALQLKEEVEIVDTMILELNPSTGKAEHPVYTVSFDSVLADDRLFGSLCMITLYGRAITQVSASKGGVKTTDSFEYKQCYNHDYPTSRSFRHISLGDATLYMLKTHPIPLFGYEKEGGPHSLEMIVRH